MSRGCAALIVAGLLVLFLAANCGGPSVRPPVPVGVFVDSLIIAQSGIAAESGDTVQFCAFARLSTGQWGIAGGGDTLPACQDLYRQWSMVRVGLSRL